jgi:hypothetical protein
MRLHRSCRFTRFISRENDFAGIVPIPVDLLEK